MAIGNAIAGAVHTAQTLTWQDEDGNAWDISSSTITGVLRPRRGGTARAITGTFAFVTDGSNGQFTWTYSAADAVEDEYWVQFKATYADTTYDLTKKIEFDVLEAM